MNLPFYIARHIYAASDGVGKTSKPAVRIALLGIAIGVAVMVITVSVVTGFKHTIRDKVVGFGGHIVISNYMTLRTTNQSLPVNADDSLVSAVKGIGGVRHVQRYSQKQGVLKTDKDFLGVMFRGVGEDFDTTFMSGNMVEGSMPRLSGKRNTQQLLLSKYMADKLRLSCGDKVYAYFLCDEDVRVRRFTVAGIYKTNLTKYDETICFADLYTVSKLNGWTYKPEEEQTNVTGIEVLVNNFDSLDMADDVVIDRINKTQDADGNPLTSATVKEMNPQIFSWLDLLNMNVWIILLLMVCVAGFTMISGLLIIILERTAMIGLLKTLGARSGLIRRTFRWLAVFIVLKGMAIGNVLGIGICLIQQHTGLIRLDAQTYYVSEVPVEINWAAIVMLNMATLIICTAALVLPSYCASVVMPAQSMRVE